MGIRKKVTLPLSSTTKRDNTELTETDSSLRCTVIGEEATDTRCNKGNFC